MPFVSKRVFRRTSAVAGLRDRLRGWLRREPKPFVPRTILIADGNAANRQSTARLIESLGYTSLQTPSVAEALERLEDQHPEFVLLGFELQDASGLEALKKIRQLDSDLPVIMLAPDLWDARVAQAMRQGAIAYLAKPFGQDDLRELLGRR
ncbi:MAG: response regulator [Chloroflexi bacterium]|nr:MAG: response regulator [Chloroflexota bacterium]